MISWYDEHYNKRERDEENKLPALRNWDSHTLSWRPEKTDHPIQGIEWDVFKQYLVNHV